MGLALGAGVAGVAILYGVNNHPVPGFEKSELSRNFTDLDYFSGKLMAEDDEIGRASCRERV